MPKISKSAFEGLAKTVRDNPDILKNLTFPEATTSKTALKTKDLRLDVHKDSKDSSMATGVVQANSGATDKSVKEFAKGATGGHKGTHQVIGEKIKFGLGDKFDVEDVAGGVEKNINS
ncbi:MAG: hypothetical protein M4579_007479 [Chaenotheca gracillima]|nr:MAG: hypothetical protein M4579_007479 [Chaenotheca gracillima]